MNEKHQNLIFLSLRTQRPLGATVVNSASEDVEMKLGKIPMMKFVAFCEIVELRAMG